jgi:hypothetical protein
MATIVCTIIAVADVANVPVAAWNNLANAIDGNQATLSDTGNLVGSSDFVDCTLDNLPPADAAITGFSVTIRSLQVENS